MKCSECGSVLTPGAAYCALCGRKVETTQGVPAGERAAANTITAGDAAPAANPGRKVHGANALSRAPIGPRLFAGFIDVAIIVALFLVLARFRILARMSFAGIVPFLLPCAYAMLRDGFGGRSIGKALMGLCVVNVRTMKPGGIAESILRNWYFAIIIVPPRLAFASLGLFLFGACVLIVAAQITFGARRRLGDGWANTQVTVSP